jgi:hypothetical protein
MQYTKKGWFKPFILNPHNIEKIVHPQTPGVYVLGNLKPDKKVKVERIKSTANVKSELQSNVGKFHVFMYKPFKHQLENSQKQASLQLRFA